MIYILNIWRNTKHYEKEIICTNSKLYLNTQLPGRLRRGNAASTNSIRRVSDYANYRPIASGRYGTAVAPEATEVATEPTEVEATPTEEVVEDNPNIIEGFDFTEFNEDGKWIGFAMHDADCDEPKVIATREDENGQEVIAILSDGEHFSQDEGKFVYYVYAPKAVKAVNFNEKMIDYEIDGVTVTKNHIQIMEDDAFENDGVQYSKTYSFWYNSHALVTDDCVAILLEYEDGSDDSMGVFITTE